MKKNLLIAALILILITTTLTGCGTSNNFLTGKNEAKTEIVKSNDVYIPIEKIRTLNPVISKDEDAYYINKLIYDGLFSFDENLNIVPVLAEDYSYSNGGYSVKIKIKNGISWHDGKPLTAEDVKFSIEAYLNASYSNQTLYSSNVKNIKSVSLDKDDSSSVVVYFISNSNVSISNFTFPIIPMHKFKNMETVKTLSSKFLPIGTGPYMLDSYNELTHIRLKGYENYHGGYTPNNTMNFQIVPDKLNAVKLLDVNNISITFSKKLDRNTIFENKDVNIVSFTSNELELIGFNLNSIATKDKRVRKAIAMAVDRENIREVAYFKNARISNSVYFPNFLGVSVKKGHYDYDITEGKKLLASAGYIDRNGDGNLENLNNEQLTINILVNSEDQSRVSSAEIIKKCLEKLSIKTNLILKDWNSYNSDLASGNFDIYLGGYIINENYDMRFLLHSLYGNQIGYKNPSLDKLLDQMESGANEEKRKQTYQQIEEILVEDLPYYGLLYKTYGAVSTPSLKGEVSPTFFNIYKGCEKWNLEYEKIIETDKE